MRRTARALVFGTLTAIIVVSFAIPAFAVHGQVPCGQYPPNPNCPSQSRGHRGGAPGLNGQTVGQGGPGDPAPAAASAADTSSGPGNSENAPGHTGTAGNSANSNGKGNHTSTTIPGVMTPAGVLVIGGFLLTLLAIRRRNRRALLGT